jgi:hypothetical protein
MTDIEILFIEDFSRSSILPDFLPADFKECFSKLSDSYILHINERLLLVVGDSENEDGFYMVKSYYPFSEYDRLFISNIDDKDVLLGSLELRVSEADFHYSDSLGAMILDEKAIQDAAKPDANGMPQKLRFSAIYVHYMDEHGAEDIHCDLDVDVETLEIIRQG